MVNLHAREDHVDRVCEAVIREARAEAPVTLAGDHH